MEIEKKNPSPRGRGFVRGTSSRGTSSRGIFPVIRGFTRSTSSRGSTRGGIPKSISSSSLSSARGARGSTRGMNYNTRKDKNDIINNNNNHKIGIDKRHNESFKTNYDSSAKKKGGKWLVITGFDSEENVDISNLKTFLLSKCSRKVNILDAKIEKHNGIPQLKLNCHSAAEASTLKQLSGIRYGQKHSKLVIDFDRFFKKDKKFGIPFEDEKVKLTKEAITNNIISCYIREQKMLNLSGRLENVLPSTSRLVVYSAIASIILENFPDMITLDISKNHISSLEDLRVIFENTKYLTSLNLAENNITDPDQLENLSLIQSQLLHLQFLGNPISKLSHYDSLVSRNIPNLITLDGREPKRILNFGISVNIENPQNLEIAGSYYHSPNISDLAEKFLPKYFGLYQQNEREKLLDAYSDESIFSLTSTVEKGKSASFYTKWSRNLKSLDDDNNQHHTTIQPFRGRADIVHFLKSLPRVTFDLRSGSVFVEGFGFDLNQIGLCSLSVHGQLIEMETDLRLSFDQTFLLTGPSQSASTLGWPAMIVNQHMHLREFFGPLPNITVQNNNINNNNNNNNNNFDDQDMNNNMNINNYVPSKEEMIYLLIKETRLKPQFAQNCLEQNQWNYQKAKEAFLKLKGSKQITPDMLEG